MNLNKLKSEFAKKHNLKQLPKNIEMNLFDPELQLTTKPIRTLSGVAPIAIMTSPKPCPHGSCTFCPGGPKSHFGNIPKSYTGNEPASMRAKRNKYDPYLQMFNRLEHYVLLNQIPEKVELIIMGGTFPSYSLTYQNNFIKYALKAMNDFSKLFFYKDKINTKKFNTFFELPGDFKSKKRTSNLHKKILKFKTKTTLEEEQKTNETAKIRNIATVIETRPDFSKKEHINQMLKLGTTRVETGVQTLEEDILKKVKRGHTIKDTIESTQLLKDSFLKTVYHLMPGLPNSTYEKDVKTFKELFNNNNFRPDGLKIYPCMVMPGTELYKEFKKGNFDPITTEQAAEIIIEGKRNIPKYCRIYRIQRDIPTKYTTAGVNLTNFRQYIHNLMEKRNLKCDCIRCREPRNRKVEWNKIKLKRFNYLASKGKEIFLSYEDTKNNILLGFLRLRIPYKPFRPEITKNSAGIRELHVYGTLASLKEKGTIQHKGLGKKLMSEAEKIAREEFDINKLLVISGIGVKEYYKKLGYKKDGIYMSKII
jgi:elongator complex protein 3